MFLHLYLHDKKLIASLLPGDTSPVAGAWAARLIAWQESDAKLAPARESARGRDHASPSRVDVLELVSEGIPFSTIIEDYYPDLDIDDVRACIRYAIDLTDAEEIHVSVAS